MKKKVSRRSHHRAPARHIHSVRSSDQYLVMVRGWMLVVAFALMLGIGALVGTFIKTQLDASTPAVAGVSTVAK